MGTVNSASRIHCASGTAVVFTSASNGISYRGLYGSCGVTPTAGAFILASAGIQARYENLSIVGFYDNMDLATGNVWSVVAGPPASGVRE